MKVVCGNGLEGCEESAAKCYYETEDGIVVVAIGREGNSDDDRNKGEVGFHAVWGREAGTIDHDCEDGGGGTDDLVEGDRYQHAVRVR